MLPPKGYDKSKRRWEEELTPIQKEQATYWFEQQQAQDLAKHGRPRVGGGFYSQSYRFKDKPLPPPRQYPLMDQHAPEWGRVPDQPERRGMPDIWGVGRPEQDPEERYHRPPGWGPKPPIGKPRPLPPRKKYPIGKPKQIRVSVHSPEGYAYTAILPPRGGKWIYDISTGKRIGVSAEIFNQLQRQGGKGIIGYKGKRTLPVVLPTPRPPETRPRPWYWDRRIETEPEPEPEPELPSGQRQGWLPVWGPHKKPSWAPTVRRKKPRPPPNLELLEKQLEKALRDRERFKGKKMPKAWESMQNRRIKMLQDKIHSHPDYKPPDSPSAGAFPWGPGASVVTGKPEGPWWWGGHDVGPSTPPGPPPGWEPGPGVGDIRVPPPPDKYTFIRRPGAAPFPPGREGEIKRAIEVMSMTGSGPRPRLFIPKDVREYIYINYMNPGGNPEIPEHWPGGGGRHPVPVQPPQPPPIDKHTFIRRPGAAPFPPGKEKQIKEAIKVLSMTGPGPRPYLFIPKWVHEYIHINYMSPGGSPEIPDSVGPGPHRVPVQPPQPPPKWVTPIIPIGPVGQKPVVGPKKPGELRPEKYRMIRKPNAPPPGPEEQAFLGTYLNMLENPRGPQPQVIIPKAVREYVRLNYMRLPEKTYRKEPIRPRAKPMSRAKLPHKKLTKPKQMPKPMPHKKLTKPKQMPKPTQKKLIGSKPKTDLEKLHALNRAISKKGGGARISKLIQQRNALNKKLKKE